MKFSDKGMALTKQFEGMSLNAYEDALGNWTIGYGHTDGVSKGMVIVQQEADEFLLQDIRWAEQAVNELVTVPVNQGQFDALVDFTFNLGYGNLHRSTLLKKLNAGDYEGAAEQFPRWNMAGGKVLGGLLDRRLAEQAMFKESAG